MAVKFTNNAATTLAAGINSSVTSISVTDGSVFPALTGSDHFYVTFDDTTNREIVKVTARSGNTLTVVRGQDNTTAQAFNSGDKAELRVVAALLEDITTEVTSTLSVDTFTGDGTTTAFTLSQAPSSEDNLIVFIEGAYQNPGDFVLSGTTLTLDEAPVVDRNIIVYHVKGAVSGNNLNQDSFTADGNTAAFTLSIAPIHENNTQVFIDGVYQQKNSYSISGTTLTLDANPSNGATVEVMTFTQTEVNTLPASFVSGLTEVTAVGADHFMIFDATDSALKKSLVSDVLESATSISTSADATAITIDSSENVTFTNNVTINSGQLTAGGLAYPTSDGTNGQVLTTDGAGTLSFSTVSGTTINNNADNRIITGSGTANTLNGESGLTYDGSTLAVTGTATMDGLTVDSDTFNFNKPTSGLGGIYFNNASNDGSAVLSNGSNAQALRLWVDRTSASNFGYLEVVDGSSAKKMLLVDDSGDISFYDDTGSTQALFWDASAESLGIGTTSPVAVLTSKNTGSLTTDSNDGDHTGFGLFVGKDTISTNTVNTAIGFGSTASGRKYAAIGMQTYADPDQNGLNFYVQTTASGSGASLTEAMRIQSYGTVCINNTGPAISTATALSVLGSGSNESVAIECRKSTTTTSSAQRFIRFFANNGSTSMGGIVGNGASNVQFAAISDERLKENIQPLSGSLNKVLALNPISYNWKDSGEYIEAGFVAQEVEQVLPEYVTTEEDADQTKGLTGGMTAGYISVLTKAIQEQQTIIDDLKSRIETLENA